MKALKAASINGLAWRTEMQRMLRAYRSTPHVMTAFTQQRLVFGRDPRTNFPEVVQGPHPDDQVVRENDRAAKGNMKAYANTKARTKASLIDISDVVLIRQRKTGKMSTTFHPRPLVVTSRNGSMVTARRQVVSLMRRNTSMFHRLPHEVAEDHAVIDDEDTEDDTEMAVPPEPPSPGRDRERVTPPVMAEVPRRSTRPRNPTQRLLEQV